MNTLKSISKSLIIGGFAIATIISCKDKKEVLPVVEETQESPKNWAEKLGFPAGKKVIIIHADDIGMSEGANAAVISQFLNNEIQSGSIMMPCPNAEEFLPWAIEHPKLDIGLHITLTSEWKNYRWGPVSDHKDVPSLIDSDGKFWHEVPDVAAHATAEDMKKEIRAQIEKSIALGYKPSHIDSHMGTVFGRPDYTKAYLDVAEEFGIPATVVDFSNPEVAETARKLGFPVNDEMIEIINNYSMPKLDMMFGLPRGKTYEEVVANFKQLINSIPPGLTEIYFHPSVNSEELKGITNSWQQRVFESKMFKDPEIIKFLEGEDIILTNWKEIMVRFKK